jgi:hypothetical protein
LLPYDTLSPGEKFCKLEVEIEEVMDGGGNDDDDDNRNSSFMIVYGAHRTFDFIFNFTCAVSD